MTTYNVGYIVGSLAKASINRKLAKALIKVAPEKLKFHEISFADLPLYSYDYDADYPAVANDFKAAIKGSDAILIVTPEYNRSIPGGLKNAIDWASRPPNQPLDGKPIAIFGTSPGATGTIRGQAHLRQILANVNGLVLVQPVVAIGNAAQRFDADANIIDEATRNFVVTMLTKLIDWTKRMKA